MYIVEGNIGAGKSTFLRLIQAHIPSISVIFEPVASWQHTISGESILANFYADPQRWAYAMETASMTSRAQEYMRVQAQNHPFQIMERSIYSGRHVFAQNGFDVGFLTALEWRIYTEWFTFLTHDVCKPPQGFIYLRVDPEMAFERIQKRQRSAESTISLDYIRKIDACHEEFLINRARMAPELRSVPVLIINCDREFENDPSEFRRHSDAVESFMFGDLLPDARHSHLAL